jgi:WD40 repeat protein
VFSAIFSPDGRWVISGSQDGKVTVWDASTGQQRFGFPAHAGHVRGVAVSPDGQFLATASWDGTARIWNFDPDRAAGPQAPLQTLKHRDRVMNVAFSPDSQRLASVGGGPDNTVRVWDVATGREIFQCEHTRLYYVTYSLDGQWLASASADCNVKIWDARTGQEKHRLPHRGRERELQPRRPLVGCHHGRRFYQGQRRD